jgi:hypothetical protein
LSARYRVIGRVEARSSVACPQTLGRDGNVYRRRDAMRPQRANQRQKAIAVVLLIRSLHVVDLTLDPEDVRHKITSPLQLARSVGHDSVQIAARPATGDLGAGYGRGSKYDLVERSAIQQKVAELGPIFPADAVRSQQGRCGDVAAPIEKIDNLLVVFRAKPLPP